MNTMRSRSRLRFIEHSIILNRTTACKLLSNILIADLFSCDQYTYAFVLISITNSSLGDGLNIRLNPCRPILFSSIIVLYIIGPCVIYWINYCLNQFFVFSSHFGSSELYQSYFVRRLVVGGGVVVVRSTSPLKVLDQFRPNLVCMTLRTRASKVVQI